MRCKFELRISARPHPDPLPQEREKGRHTLPISVAVGATLRFVSVRSPTRSYGLHAGERFTLSWGKGPVRASVHLTFLSLLIRAVLRNPAGQAHFASSIPLPPDFQSVGSSIVNPPQLVEGTGLDTVFHLASATDRTLAERWVLRENPSAPDQQSSLFLELNRVAV